MIELGKRQELWIVKKVDFGVYLSSEKEEDKEKVLLPGKEVPEKAEIGDKVNVFIYRDSKDRMIATVRQTEFSVGETAVLTVKEVGRIGAFLGWALEKDLLLPFKEQTKALKAGEECLVALYVDKSGRLCTTMKVYPYLRTDSPYKQDDRVTGRVYEISDNFGAFVAVDNLYSGLIPKKELYGDVKLGMDVKARVIQVREDGKLTLGIREKAYLQMDADAEKLLSIIDSYEGVLPFGEKASPEVIAHETGMSKNEFKRAVGRLLKEGRIEIKDKVIRRVPEGKRE